MAKSEEKLVWSGFNLTTLRDLERKTSLELTCALEIKDLINDKEPLLYRTLSLTGKFFERVSLDFSYFDTRDDDNTCSTSILINYSKAIAYLLPITKLIDIKVIEYSYYSGYHSNYEFIIDDDKFVAFLIYSGGIDMFDKINMIFSKNNYSNGIKYILSRSFHTTNNPIKLVNQLLKQFHTVEDGLLKTMLHNVIQQR